MSEPTYRIVTSYDPSYATIPWAAHVYRVSDDTRVCRGDGATSAEAIRDAQRLIGEHRNAPEPETLYADEAGEIVPAPEPQSLRA